MSLRSPNLTHFPRDFHKATVPLLLSPFSEPSGCASYLMLEVACERDLE